MDRKVETSLFKILDMVKLFRGEGGTLGSLAREGLADILDVPPSALEVRAYLDAKDIEAECMSIDEALAEHAGDAEAIEEIWRDVRYDEEPIAEFLMLWKPDGTRRESYEAILSGDGPVWHVTPKEYQ